MARVPAIVNRGADDHAVMPLEIQARPGRVGPLRFHAMPLVLQPLRDVFGHPRGMTFAGRVNYQDLRHGPKE